MVKGNTKTIDAHFKRRRTDQESVNEDPSTHPPPLFQLEQQNQEELEVQRNNEQVLFRGIEFLERDPAKRPQIWQYPPNQRDVVKRRAITRHIVYFALSPTKERPNKVVLMSSPFKVLDPGRRGHDETEQSRNKGNFLELIMLLAEFNPDIAEVVLRNAPYNSKYTSPDIQKEILGIFAAKVRKQIRDEIGDSKFAILVDETCDASKREQMAVVFRFVDSNDILQERFFDLIHVTNTKAATLKENLCSMLSNHSFDIQNLCGQGYDGASNMKRELNGLQALFMRECPYAYYVHCYAHRLQLALVDAAKDVVPVTQFFQKLNFIVTTVDSSSKRHDELHEAQMVEMARRLAIDDHETGQGANQICALKQPGDTRWGSHFGSILSLMHLFNAVSSVLQNLAADSSAGANRADGDTSFNYLTSFEFIFIMCMMKEIMEITDDLNRALQKKSQDLVNAVRLVHSTKVLLGQLRSDDGWEDFFIRVTEFCVNHGIDIPDMQETYIMRGGRARRQADHFTKEL
ncbi:zinc finger MYM-type protein 1-like [Panicum virgatum]|nr:zinc finger MYM-type protein 1-like [Panicum virgatum]